jgi:phenylacetate-CoA ligase
LIRYDIGDIAKFDNTGCECQRCFPVLKEISGRKDDIIITPDGRFIGRLDPIFKGINTVISAQIQQVSSKDLVIYIIPGSDFSSHDESKILNELINRVGKDFSISLHKVEKIELTRSGKLRSVISNLTNQ